MKNQKERCLIIEAPDNKAVIDLLSANASITITVEDGHINIEAKLFTDEDSYYWKTKSVSWKLPEPDKD